MKLISCHIENYGKIQNADFSFDPLFTTILRENGAGKTTLASFLRAMFYGLDSDRANSNFNERRRFYPFSGGNFGGNVTFEMQGKTYKIERYFDEKSETKDSLIVYCNGSVLPPFDCPVGEKIFGIDKPSFDRTIFVTGAEIEISSTGSINTKLNNFVAGSDDDADLFEALSRLEQKSKEYKKSRTGNDLITKETLHKNALAEEIENKKAIKAFLVGKYQSFDEYTQNISKLTEEIGVAQSRNILLKDWERYDAMRSEADAKKAEISLIEQNYPLGIPTKRELDEANEALGRDAALNAKLSKKIISEEESAKLSLLQETFSQGTPDEERLAEIQKKIEEGQRLSFEEDALQKEELTEKDRVLLQKFQIRVPRQDEIDKIKEDESALRAAEEECSKVSAPAPECEKPKSQKITILIAVLFALLTVGGIGTIFVNQIAGFVLLGVGLVGLIATGFFYLNKKSGGNLPLAQSDPEKEAARKRADELLSHLKAALIPFGYSFEHGASYAVASFENDVKEYLALKKRQEDAQKAREDLSRKRADLQEELERFFEKFGLESGSFSDRMKKLLSGLHSYRDLSKRKQTSLEDESRTQSEIAENRKILYAFCEKYKLGWEDLSEKIKCILHDAEECEAAKRAFSEREEAISRFEAEKKLEERPSGEIADIKVLNEALTKAQEEKNLLYTQILSDERDVEKLNDLFSELEETDRLLKEYKAEYEVLQKTMECLKKADRNLKDRYIKPVKEQFIFYSDLLEKTLGEKVSMNENFEIRFERFGKERSERHLSSGQRSLCALCFRLALIDNMYAEERPFIILDDPFVNLDAEHIQKAKILIKKLSEKMQILYFSCHESRAF